MFAIGLMKKIAVFFVFLFCSFTVLAQSGTMTDYERGRYEIANTALKKVTEPLNQEQQLLIALVYTKMRKDVEDIFDATTVMENIVYKYCALDGEFASDANYLPQFRYPEKNLIGNYQREWREAAKWYRDERRKLDATKTGDDATRERERNNYKKGKGDIINSISRSFVLWAMSRDGEDAAAYHARLDACALDVLDSLAFKFCDNAWKAPMVLVKGRYDNDAGELALKYFNAGDRESRPLQGRFAISAFDASLFDTKDVVESESYAMGLSFRDGLCYPSALCLNLRGVKDGISVKFAPDDAFTIKGESIKIDGTRRFVDAVTPYLKDHIFNYTEYVASRTFRNALYGEMYAMYGNCVRIFGADPGIRVEQFMPDGLHFSRKTVDGLLDDFCGYCLVAAQRGLYGPYISRCSDVISLDELRGNLRYADKAALRDMADKAVDAYLKSLAGKITGEQVGMACPEGELSDALALIFGMHYSGSELDVNSKAGLLVEQCPSLGLRFSFKKIALRKDSAPYVRFLMNEYPEFVKIKQYKR